MANTIDVSRVQTKRCTYCTSNDLELDLLLSYGEAVCHNCRKKRTGYCGISKKRAKEEFCLTDSAMARLAFKEKLNPRNASFTPMKMYLTKHVKDLAISLYGSIKDLEYEKEKRKEKALERKKGHRKKSFLEGSSNLERASLSLISSKRDLEVENNPFAELKARRTFGSSLAASETLLSSRSGLVGRAAGGMRQKRRKVSQSNMGKHTHSFVDTGERKLTSVGTSITIEKCACGFLQEVEEL
jgi:hypothetical protein